MEVRQVGSHATADDVVEGRAQLPRVLDNNMADTLARMSADSVECDEAQVLLNTHLEQLATAIRKRGHLVNLAAHQVEPAERAPRERSSQPRHRRLDRNVNGCSRRQRTLSPRLTTIITASPATPQSRKIDSTLGCSRARVQQCFLTRPFPSLSGADLCTSPTRSLSWTTGAPGSVRLVDTSRAYMPSSSLNLARVSYPKSADEI